MLLVVFREDPRVRFGLCRALPQREVLAALGARVRGSLQAGGYRCLDF